MNFIDIFSWLVLLIMIGSFVAIFVFMGLWPGMIAKKRHHRQAEAIQIGSWVTLLMGFALWPVILIWAYTKPPIIANSKTNSQTESASLDKKGDEK